MADEVKVPKVKERFIYTPSFKGKKVRMLNSDGYLDFAHQKGLVSLITEFIRERETTTVVTMKDDFGKIERDEKNNPITNTVVTRYVLFKATAVVRSSDGNTITATGWREASDKDTKAVHEPWHLIAVAETRAIKAALASACGITEELISPNAKAPTREAEDIGLEGDEPDIPQAVRKKADISPPLSGPIDDHNPPGGTDDWTFTPS